MTSKWQMKQKWPRLVLMPEIEYMFNWYWKYHKNKNVAIPSFLWCDSVNPFQILCNIDCSIPRSNCYCHLVSVSLCSNSFFSQSFKNDFDSVKRNEYYYFHDKPKIVLKMFLHHETTLGQIVGCIFQNGTFNVFFSINEVWFIWFTFNRRKKNNDEDEDGDEDDENTFNSHKFN